MRLHGIGKVLSAVIFSIFAIAPALAQTTPENATDKTEPDAPEATVTTPQPEPAQHTFTAVRSVELGMTVEEVKDKLGKPEFQDNTSLVFELDKGDTVQIGLGPDKKVRTIAAVFTAESDAAPSFVEVFGTAAGEGEGDVYKMERYPDAGYWVSFSRTNSKDDPITVVTLKKIL